MPRVNIKGGVWKNTEDEILKAAVMKYGKNQWSRIASLLHRKSAKQCKARWYEWLDPSIKKTEWSREEEEKLLHLAKLMPTQWRTIAPLVGRTAAQCLEHYDYLLREAQKKDGDVDDDAHRLRPGEIDPAPETKPARPDPIDMDEDEKEMLAEARARLANTQGKKAKRKAREKQLEEARRLATLQKRRELQAAGIEVRKRRLKKGLIDYNAEIPFEKKPALGFYDTSAETIDVTDPNYKKLRLHELDEKRRDEEEQRQRHKDKEKLAKRQEGDAPGAVRQLNQMNMINPAKKRSKLVLPSPQITEAELDEVVKMGRTSENIAAEASAAGSGASNMLLSNYTFNTPAAGSNAGLRTPRTPATSTSIMAEAQNMLALTNVETPLKGGTNAALNEVDFGGATPASKVVATPNTVLGTPVNSSDFNATPRVNGSQTPMSVRDQLSINANGGETPLVNGTSKLSLKDSLTSLPKPLNDFEIALPEEEEEAEQEEKKRAQVEDQQDVDDMTQEERRRAAQEKWKRENQVIQRALPRPGGINTSILRSNLGDFQLTALQTAEEKIKEEMVLLLKHDSKKHPLGNKPPPSGNLPELPIYSDSDLEKSRELLKKEVETVKKGMNHGDLTLDAYSQVWEECYREVMFNVGQSKYTRASMSSKKDRIEFLEKALDVNRQLMTKEAKQAAKIEKKLKVILGGYQAKAMALSKQIEEINDQLDTVSVENVTYSKLRETEQSIIPYRLQKLQDHLQRQIEREKGLQDKFKSLLDQRKELTLDLAKLSASPV